jgi:regulation of enolase protein 1 (concanavalin A-like superfamily)
MAETILNEQFYGPTPDARLRWLNPPSAWSIQSARLLVQPAANTDFWQQTHYGFRADNGHFLHFEVAGNFTATTEVRFHPAHQYDQAGLMVRVGSSCWIKTSVEYESEGPSKVGVVVTNHSHSDWSLQDFPRERNEVRLRIRRVAQDFLVEWSSATSERWELLRVTHLHEGVGQPVMCGLYACSPKGDGFRAEFKFLLIESDFTSKVPVEKPLPLPTALPTVSGC